MRYSGRYLGVAQYGASPCCYRSRIKQGGARCNWEEQFRYSIYSILVDPKSYIAFAVGIIMSMHLYHQLTTSGFKSLRILLAYEDGSVVLREYTRTSKEASVEGQGWDVLWKSKLHAETSAQFRYLSFLSYRLKHITVMAMSVSRANDFAITVSADHIIGRYDLTVRSRLWNCICQKYFDLFHERTTTRPLKNMALLIVQSMPGTGQLRYGVMAKYVLQEAGTESKQIWTRCHTFTYARNRQDPIVFHKTFQTARNPKISQIRLSVHCIRSNVRYGHEVTPRTWWCRRLWWTERGG